MSIGAGKDGRRSCRKDASTQAPAEAGPRPRWKGGATRGVEKCAKNSAPPTYSGSVTIEGGAGAAILLGGLAIIVAGFVTAVAATTAIRARARAAAAEDALWGDDVLPEGWVADDVLPEDLSE
ncbi:hypothetical protein [Demequina pelophila]|uniref:hypothetical protein n=1 Tax=Demequina pelophila TaxID=1638984 RepID=UPI0007858A8F|nr:hypothetical protein [Demequina pelophila]